jgi:hypothetical protein
LRKSFPGHYTPSQSDLERMLKTGVVVLDANVLLDLYKFTPKTRKVFLSILECLKERLWIPHQVGKEYQKNRTTKIEEQLRAYKKLSSTFSTWTSALDSFKQHPFIDREQLLTEVKEASEKMVSLLEQGAKGILGKEPKHAFPEICEELHIQIAEMYDGKVGPPYEEKNLQEKVTIALERYAKKIPPGYKDASTQEETTPGDGLLWLQLLDKASSEKDQKPFLFVTGEEKPDWWFKNEKKELLAPRKELVEEMRFVANSEFWLIHTRDFIPLAEKVFGIESSEAVIREIEALAKDVNYTNFHITMEPTSISSLRNLIHGLYGEIMLLLTTLSEATERVSPLTFSLALATIVNKGLISIEDSRTVQRALEKAVDAMTMQNPDAEDLEFYADWLEYIIQKLQDAAG